ncbi:hypothetical protein EXN24_06940 [Rhizobium rhizogenes]|uniref:Uncharacterized protein n=2 Tax=Rhizobium/Agrobacterium group TaxID=227290 RepID=A0AA95AJI4_RHIRH|nr:hypothetical protein DXM26_08210 [Agrobacterium tumefaciens]TRA91228.1 hypothetical protein EXN24_06940 [Rhizobium rhizogenes]
MRQCFPLDFSGGRGCFDKASRRIQYGLVARPSKPYLPAMEPDSQPLPKRPLTEILFLVFMRLVAVSCFWFGLQYWAMLTGYSLGGHGRFDMLNLPWRVAGSALAVIFPVAALGLWLGASWGAVMWVLGAGTQIAMYKVWPYIFGANTLVPVMHGLVATIYILFLVAFWLDQRQNEERARIDLP